MSTAYPTAHEAYRAAADLAPKARFEPRVVDAEWRFVDREFEVKWSDVIAVGGSVFFLFAGALLGEWLHIPL